MVPWPPPAVRVAALRARLEADGGGPVRRVETHVSWLLLGPARAYKLKKPVRLAFLDFSTLAARRHCCEEELRLNRRLAPSIYLGVDAVREGPGGPAFGDGPGPVVDFAVRMRRFPDGALWSERLAAGTLATAEVDALARRLADFHRDAPAAAPESGFGTPAVQARVTRGVAAGIDAVRGGDAEWPGLRGWLLGRAAALAPLWRARRRAGRVREGHGDLHLANVLQLDGAPAAFDGIEFDPALRWIDVLDDAAFLVMDLLAHGRRDLAFGFLDGWLEAGGDHDGLPALRFFLVRRALVRAQVAALASGRGTAPAAQPQRGAGAAPAAAPPCDAPPSPGCDAGGYFALAVALARGADARLAITHGLPGSGKSFVSRAVLERAGAIRLRSDVERKRLHGLAALDPSGDVPGGIYGAAATAATYDRLHDLARTALQAGWPVVVDAAFLRRAERARFAALARTLAVPFAILDCRAPPALLRERLARRQAHGGDASEADAGVLDRLRGFDEPLGEAERPAAIDAGAGADAGEATRRWLAAR